MKSITVFVITYNQEDVISRALDSILCQKDWGLYQVIIGDDCSTDGTYNILLDYKEKYPNIIRPYRNEHNLGIYGNLQNLISLRDSSDLYTSCSGDDAFCDGFFKGIQELIIKEKISTEEEVGIYSDWKTINTSGNETIYRQDIVTKQYDLWRLHMRGRIGNRSLVFTKSIIDKFKPIILDQGLHLAEGLYCSQAPRHIKKIFYLPQVTSIYYTGIGVSTILSKTDYNTTGNIVKWDYFINNLITNKSDIFYAKYQIYRSKYIIAPNIKNYLALLWFYVLGVYPRTLKNYKEIFGIGYYLMRYAILNRNV